MKTIILLGLLLTSSAHAGLYHFVCTPAVANESHWFKSLELFIGREYQVSGSYTGFQVEGDKRTSLDDKTQFFVPELTATPELNSIAVHMDFKGRMGSDEEDLTITIHSDGSAVLTGRTMIDCGDGNWSPVKEQLYTCH